ncbi:AtpZ/AtpI family protein [Romboutsia sp.]|uniref:AtpZ/AtpI family protein n=1 Tax=Romboutsia sp. TaxID=1965302 RepID=UPI003F667716
MEIANTLSLLSQLGLMMLIPILGLAYVGKALDTKLNTSPMFILIFMILGIGGGFMGVYKTLKVYMKRK